MTDDDDEERDLFGQPIPKKGPKGRTIAYARSDDPSTAKTAARKIYFTNSQWDVFEAMVKMDRDVTSLCVTRYFKDTGREKVWSVSPRFVPLWKEVGVIEPAGELTVIGSNGKPAKLQAWRVKPEYKNTPKEPPPDPPMELTPQKPPETNAYCDEEGRILNKGCCVCGAPAPFSTGTFVRKGILGLWFCRLHWPGRAALEKGAAA